MGRPRKIKEQEIEQEMNSNVAVLDKPKDGEITIAKEVPKEVKTSHEFGDEYTLEVVSDNEPGADIMRIPNKDPNFEYRFLRDTKENMSIKTSNLLLMKGGWQICPVSHLVRIGIKKDLLHPDGSYRVGELILAFMPKKLFEKKSLKDRERADSAMSGVQRLVDGETRINVPGVHGISKGKLKKGPLDYGSHNSIEE
jgi:hypothetical protein